MFQQMIDTPGKKGPMCTSSFVPQALRWFFSVNHGADLAVQYRKALIAGFHDSDWIQGHSSEEEIDRILLKQGLGSAT